MRSSGPTTRTTRRTARLDEAIKILNEPEPLIACKKATTAKWKKKHPTATKEKHPPTDADLAKERKRLEKLRLACLRRNQRELNAECDEAFFPSVSAGSAASVQSAILPISGPSTPQSNPTSHVSTPMNPTIFTSGPLQLAPARTALRLAPGVIRVFLTPQPLPPIPALKQQQRRPPQHTGTLDLAHFITRSETTGEQHCNLCSYVIIFIFSFS